MGSNLGKSSAELHKEADEASSPHVSEVINPRRTLARREEAAGLPVTDTRRAAPPPAAAPAPSMSQADFGKGGGGRSQPPADLLNRHRNK